MLSTEPENVVKSESYTRKISKNFKKTWDSVKITVFVIGTALVIFAAACNSITWHLQKFWGASGNFWQYLWETLMNWLQKDQQWLLIWGTFIITNSVFFGFNLFLLILDSTGFPEFLLQYKIQEDQKVDRKKLFKSLAWVIFNQTAVFIPILYLTYPFTSSRIDTGLQLPSFTRVLLELCVFILVEELMFYYSHRLLHHRLIYRFIHKRHHEWTAPVGIIGLYAHPIEHIISNLLPPAVGPAITGAHLSSMWLWYALALISTSISHCGYHFPLLPSPEAHDYHHLKFVNNFGVLGVLDRFHGTDNLFRASKPYRRHFLLLGLTPLSKSIPNDKKLK